MATVELYKLQSHRHAVHSPRRGPGRCKRLSTDVARCWHCLAPVFVDARPLEQSGDNPWTEEDERAPAATTVEADNTSLYRGRSATT